MSITFELIDVVIVIGICQGIFLSLTLQRITNNNRPANNILSLLLITATFILIGRFLFFRIRTAWMFQWSLFGDALIFIFGPLLYTYVRRLLFKANTNFRLALWHFLPFFTIILLSLVLVVIWSPNNYYQLYLNGKWSVMFNIIIIAGLFSNGYYLVRTYLLLRGFTSRQRDTFSFKQSPLQYLYFFLFAVALAVTAWLFSYVNGTFFNRYFNYIGYEGIWIAIPILIYIIGYFSLKQPELFRMPLDNHKFTKKERLGEKEIASLSKKLDSIMVNEKLFLQSDLTLKEVAALLHTSTNNISWLLNNIYRTNFYDFVNDFRIKEFLQKIENNEHLRHTILAMSIDVGFNSKSTFNKAFKTKMNDTPSNFIKKYRAA